MDLLTEFLNIVNLVEKLFNMDYIFNVYQIIEEKGIKIKFGEDIFQPLITMYKIYGCTKLNYTLNMENFQCKTITLITLRSCSENKNGVFVKSHVFGFEIILPKGSILLIELNKFEKILITIHVIDNKVEIQLQPKLNYVNYNIRNSKFVLNLRDTKITINTFMFMLLNKEFLIELFEKIKEQVKFKTSGTYVIEFIENFIQLLSKLPNLIM